MDELSELYCQRAEIRRSYPMTKYTIDTPEIKKARLKIHAIEKQILAIEYPEHMQELQNQQTDPRV